MKKGLKLFLFFLTFSLTLSYITKGQEISKECVNLLRDGLRDEYVAKDGASFFSEAKRYFASEEFKSDYKTGKWSGGVSLVGFSLGGNASETELNEFQKKVREASEIKISDNSYRSIARSTLNIKLANAFNDCIELTAKFGPSIQLSGDKTAVVIIRYKGVGNDAHPQINSVELRGVDETERDKILENVLYAGRTIPNEITFTVTRKPTEEMVVVVNTSNGASTFKRLEPSELSADAAANPVGTIVASMLNFEKFSELTKSNMTSPSGNWSYRSMWAPCDGRSVIGSKYHIYAAPYGEDVPDLRGAFTRGLNQFDRDEPKPVASIQANPESKKPGELQVDGIKEHDHDLNDNGKFASAYRHKSDDLEGGSERRWAVPYDLIITVLKTGSGLNPNETRPKNVSIYYYIRIN